MANDINIVIGAQDKASRVIDDVAKKVGGVSTAFAAVGPVVAGLGVGLAAAASAFASAQFAVDGVLASFERIDALTDTAAGLGESVGQLQAFQFAMSEAGNVGADKSIDALQKIQKIVGEVASGAGAGAGDVFGQLGLDAAQLSLMGPVDQFLALKESIAAIENPSERAATAQKLLGKSAADLIPALLANQSEFKASMDAAYGLNLAVEESGAAGIAAMNDAIGRVSGGFEGLANTVAIAIAPAVESVANELALWLPPIVELAETYLPAAVDATVMLVGYTYDYVDTLSKVATLDLSGAVSSMTDGISAADTMLKAVYDARERAEQAALENAEKRKSLAQSITAIDTEGVKQQEAAARAAAKTVEQLERQLQVSQVGEDAVKKQEQLASATNDIERERIRLLQEQIDKQEALNEAALKATRDKEEAVKLKEKEEADKAKSAAEQQAAFANVQPGTQATESRLLTRGPAEKGIDKIAKHTEETAKVLKERLPLSTSTSVKTQTELVVVM